ncbi:MAG TPA: flavin monoamine oxidase family protein, partial [Thermomicrobiales bacterium]|nr:flavin monoamine oxidase family protein [Thermomicrobiales bacterium]
RGGTTETEIGGPAQTCAFDDGLYLNPGPARIPQHHRALLGYCKEFGVALEVLVNRNGAAYSYQETRGPAGGPLAGRALRRRAVWADLRGYIAELLAKAVGADALDAALTREDRDRLLAYLHTFGDLADPARYAGSYRRGYVVPPGAGLQAGEVGAPFALAPLLAADFWDQLDFEWDEDQEPPLFQPVGGMDRIAAAFEQRVGRTIAYECEVREIRRTPAGVRVAYFDRRRGQTVQLDGDYCVCTLPLPVLRAIPNDLPPAVQAAIGQVDYVPVVKAGLQFARRFWEDDEALYGGITWTNQPIGQIWYPSTGYHVRKGVVLGAYARYDDAVALGRLAPPAREEQILAQGARIHPQYPAEFETGFSVAWHRIPYTGGGWAEYSPRARRAAYPLLTQSDGVIYLAGEHLSYLTGWQEGAILSAHAVIGQIAGRPARPRYE